MERRHDIDGIRAIAVGLVVLCHAKVAGFSGGWIGVDVFFVLSGYLITRIVLDGQAKGTFSMRAFMQRRLTRLAPAFLVVSFVSLAVFAAIMPFLFLQPAATTLKWAAFGLANFEQAKSAGYFGEDGYMNPYTHLWSLGVEEQFYLVFPLVAVFFRRMPTKVLLFSALAVASYAALLAQSDQESAYFWPWTRSWGLLMGAAVAAYTHAYGTPMFGSWAGWVGVPIILLAAALGNDTGVYWHLFSLTAAAGTALAVGSSGQGLGKWLSHRWMVGVGLASYSLYLVHQPVLVAAQVWSGGYALGAWATAGTIGIILGLGFALRAWVEVPYIKGRARLMFVRGISLYLILGLLSMWTAYGHLNPYRTALAQTWGGGVDVSARMAINFGAENAVLAANDVVTTEGPSGVYLWGDSHAMHLARALETAGIPYTQRTKSACPPSDGFGVYTSPGTSYNNREWAIQCMAFNTNTLDEIRAQPKPGVVILVALSWTPDNGEETMLDSKNGIERPTSGPAERIDLTFGTAVAALREAGWKVVTVSPNLYVDTNPGRCNALMLWMGQHPEKRCSFMAQHTETFANHIQLEDTLEAYANTGLTRHISLLDIICPDGLCVPYQDGVLIWRDQGHLSQEGSAWLGRQPAFANAVRKVVGAEGTPQPATNADAAAPQR